MQRNPVIGCGKHSRTRVALDRATHTTRLYPMRLKPTLDGSLS
ncbi:hypothetical protein [Halopseudomonas sp.]